MLPQVTLPHRPHNGGPTRGATTVPTLVVQYTSPPTISRDPVECDRLRIVRRQLHRPHLGLVADSRRTAPAPLDDGSAKHRRSTLAQESRHCRGFSSDGCLLVPLHVGASSTIRIKLNSTATISRAYIHYQRIHIVPYKSNKLSQYRDNNQWCGTLYIKHFH